MTAFSSSDTFRPIGQIVATEVMPVLPRLRRLPMQVSCLGTESHEGGEKANSFDRTIPLGECPSAEDAMRFASLRLSQGDICTTPDGCRTDRGPDNLRPGRRAATAPAPCHGH